MCLRKLVGRAPRKGKGYKYFYPHSTAFNTIRGVFQDTIHTIGKWEEADSSQTLTCVDPQIDGGTSIPKRVRRRKYKSGFHILKDKPKRLGPFGYLYEVEYDKGTVIGKDRTVTTGASGVDCIIAQRMRIIRKI